MNLAPRATCVLGVFADPAKKINDRDVEQGF